ncbi:hypothetical protein AVEN_206938-2-1, partial [Araneus ventricosus]
TTILSPLSDDVPEKRSMKKNEIQQKLFCIHKRQEIITLDQLLLEFNVTYHEYVNIIRSGLKRDNKKGTVNIDKFKAAHLLPHSFNLSESKLASPRVDTSSPSPLTTEPLSEKLPVLVGELISLLSIKILYLPSTSSINKTTSNTSLITIEQLQRRVEVLKILSLLRSPHLSRPVHRLQPCPSSPS